MTRQLSPDLVLVIDDNPDFCELVEMVGHLYRVPVLSASDCRKGLQVIAREKSRIKLIFLDYFMPGMDPASCAQAIMREVGPSVSVVLVTAAADPSARAAELHLNRWVAKPVDPSVLGGLMTASNRR